MPIEKVILENFKTHVRTEIPLSRLTVLVGPNSVGKTSVLEGIRYVANLTWADPNSTDPVRFFRRGADRCGVKLVLSTEKDEFVRVGLIGQENDFEVEFAWKRDEEEGGASTPHPRWKRFVERAVRILQRDVGTATQLRLETHRLAAPCRVQVGEKTTRLAIDGSGLAGVLSLMRLFDEDLFDALEQALRRIVPSVERLRIVKVPFKEMQRAYHEEIEGWAEHEVTLDGAELRFDFVGAPDIPASEVSEGTLLALGVLTAARGGSSPRLVLLDDIERALHPRAQRQFVENLRTILDGVPGLQIIATSHSPYLVDAFSPEEVVVLGFKEDGTAAARRLSDHPDAKRAMEVLSTGEFLAAEQEDWVVKETP
jgi:predicted ATPase